MADVVITVPAYFGNNERELTRQAGAAAGLNVLALLNEPTAAALSYGAHKLEGKTFMVYDLGGGTFDVSIMKVNNGALETLSTDGDHHLGGVDWDTELVNYALKNGCNVELTYQDIKDSRDGGALILAAEQCKKFLSKNEESPMRFRYKNRMYSVPIKRTKFEEITAYLLERTIKIVRHVMEISTQKNPNIDEIILVGGSSYMPMVKNRLKREFPGVTIKLDQFEPDLAVAKGAAIHAYNLANPLLNSRGAVKIAKDLGSRSYGMSTTDTETQKEIIQNLILRTDPMVYDGVTYFFTLKEGQIKVKISIYENTCIDRKISLEEGKLIATQTIEWGYPVPKSTRITVKIKRGPDGIIHIEAECEKKKVFFDIKPEHALTDAEMRTLKNDLSNMQL